MVEKLGEKASRVPASSGVPTFSKVDEQQTPEEKKEMFKFPYREAVGALTWVAMMTRLNIASVVRAVARFCETPGLAHKKAEWKVKQYLFHTKE